MTRAVFWPLLLTLGGCAVVLYAREFPNLDPPQDMDTILETNAAVESVRQAFDGNSDRPRPEWVRGECPQCGEPLVSNCYYVGGKGYLVVWDCWASLGSVPTCSYRKII